MKKVRFVEDFDFAEDGINPTRFLAGSEREVSDSCADSAVQERKAIYLDDDAAAKAKDDALKALAGPPVYVSSAPEAATAQKAVRAAKAQPKTTQQTQQKKAKK